jgi:hypothetical protein
MPKRRFAIIALACLGAAALYVVGVIAGAFSIVGYASGNERLWGFYGERWFPLRFGLPMWLPSGTAVRADYVVDAKFGSLSLTVWPPVLLRTSLQAATAYVPGRRQGSVLFVIQSPGWYSLNNNATSIGGPRCPRERSLAEIVVGSRDCPAYDVSYRVVWRLVDAQRVPATVPRLTVPRPNEALVSRHIDG